jgi:hypothetical protein
MAKPAGPCRTGGPAERRDQILRRLILACGNQGFAFMDHGLIET